MPNLDGMSFLSALKKSSTFSEVPFIMVTADSNKEHVVDAISAGVSGYVIKPLHRISSKIRSFKL